MGYYPTSDAMDWITDDDRGREINGRGGNDRFYGGAGNDVLIGGSGRDTLYGRWGTMCSTAATITTRFPAAPMTICCISMANKGYFRRSMTSRTALRRPASTQPGSTGGDHRGGGADDDRCRPNAPTWRLFAHGGAMSMMTCRHGAEAPARMGNDHFAGYGKDTTSQWCRGMATSYGHPSRRLCPALLGRDVSFPAGTQVGRRRVIGHGRVGTPKADASARQRQLVAPHRRRINRRAAG